MLIGARAGCVADGDLADRLGLLKRLGYDFLELPLSAAEIGGLGPASPDDYRAAVARAGLPILSTSMGHFGNFGAGAPDERARLLAHIRALIPFTRAIGADTILLATTEEAGDPVACADTYRRELGPVADEAAGAGITLALEHVGWYQPTALAALVRAIDHPAIRIYFDMGNCLYVGEDPLAGARACAPLAAQLHIKGGPVAPLAAMPLAAIRESLVGAGFTGRGCLEIEPGPDNRPLAEARGLLKMAGYC